MKNAFSWIFVALAIVIAIGVLSVPHRKKLTQAPPKIEIVDWDQWYQTRSANLKDDIARSHYSDGGGPITPKTADEYLEALGKRGWLYNEFLPPEEYRKATQHFLDEFPIVDLNSRLAYEDRKGIRSKHSRKHKYWLSSMAKQLHKNWNDEHIERSVQERSLEIPIPELTWVYRGRHQRALEILHRDRLEAFAQQDSFGFQRIRDISMEDLYTQEQETDYITPQSSEVAKQRRVMSLTEDELKTFPKQMHLRNYFSFGADMAYAPEFRKARGHISHSIYSMMTPDSLQLKSLELVSLLKYDVPKVYVSDRFPDMKLLSKAKTRDLDSFESSSLKKLFGGEFVVVDESPQRMQVLGAVHAGETCIECHAVKQGELLGAFSYKFNRVMGVPLTLNP